MLFLFLDKVAPREIFGLSYIAFYTWKTNVHVVGNILRIYVFF